MLRYDRQTKPGLVALYDIRPGNGAGRFLQRPRARTERVGLIVSLFRPIYLSCPDPTFIRLYGTI